MMIILNESLFLDFLEHVRRKIDESSRREVVGESDQQRLDPQDVEFSAFRNADRDDGDDEQREQSADAADWKAKRRAFLRGFVFEIHREGSFDTGSGGRQKRDCNDTVEF